MGCLFEQIMKGWIIWSKTQHKTINIVRWTRAKQSGHLWKLCGLNKTWGWQNRNNDSNRTNRNCDIQKQIMVKTNKYNEPQNDWIKLIQHVLAYLTLWECLFGPMIEPCTIMHHFASIAQIAVAQSKHLQYIVLTGIEATVSTSNGNISHLKSRWYL